MAFIYWLLAVFLWIAVIGFWASFFWKWRRVATFCLIAFLSVMSLGLLVALVWRAAQWWLRVLPVI